MADKDKTPAHTSPPVVMTARNLPEQKSPFPHAGADTRAKGDVTGEAASSDEPTNPQPRRMQTDIAPDRPPVPHKSLTEQERKRSWKRLSPVTSRRRTPSDKPAQLQRQATLTFDDDEDDDSSSSSDEYSTPLEERPPATALSSPSSHEMSTSASPNAPSHPRLRHKSTSSDTGAKLQKSGKKQSRRGPFSGFRISHSDFLTTGHISKRDGRLKLRINETVNRGYFAKTLGAGLKKHMRLRNAEDVAAEHRKDDIRSAVSYQDPVSGDKIAPEDDDMEDPERRVKLNIVIIIIGSRGDIQPFLRIGKILKDDYGHRVRIASHPAFRDFVEKDVGLEFFSVGGNPSELMAFMVKNPGLFPNFETIKEGEVGRRRAAMYDMFQGMWRACVNATDDETSPENLAMMGSKDPFVADAIIANPPSFAPPHIAERLGIPLHMMFTFPYSPTVQFPHPLANIKKSNVDANYTNFMSYPLVEMMTWQGLGDLVNRFRKKCLGLDEVSTLWAPGQLYRLRVPYTYMWSPSLVPKPKDWGPEISLSGFVFLDLASSYTPPDDLAAFLAAGPPPVYIGFGSIVVDDPDAFTQLIFKAIKLAGVRALVSKGWGGFGSNATAPDGVFMLENTPHDWLFPRVSAVVHHGGAGTTAIGLKCARPTMIVPFFGDQPFWGAWVAKAGAGAKECVPYRRLTAERLAQGIKECLTDEARENVAKIAKSIEEEGDGALNAVRSFHRSLPLKSVTPSEPNLRCMLLPNRAAAWNLKGTELRLCPLAAELLVRWKKIKYSELRLLRVYEWNDFGGPGEPVTGMWGAIVGMGEDVLGGLGGAGWRVARSVRVREKYYRRKIKERRKKRLREKQRNAGSNHAQQSKSHAEQKALPNGSTDSHASSQPLNGHAHHPSTAHSPDANSKLKRTSTTEAEDDADDLRPPQTWLYQDALSYLSTGFKKTSLALLKSPLTLSLALTQGFHNAPRLYGDETVRRPHRITGFHSGLRAGRDELVFGVRDGVTGLYYHPVHEVRAARRAVRGRGSGTVLMKEVGGAARGAAMGVGGLVLKDIAALLGPMSYTLKGLEEEARKRHSPTTFLRRARILQGRVEVEGLGPKRGRGRGRGMGRGAGERDVVGKGMQEKVGKRASNPGTGTGMGSESGTTTTTAAAEAQKLTNTDTGATNSAHPNIHPAEYTHSTNDDDIDNDNRKAPEPVPTLHSTSSTLLAPALPPTLPSPYDPRTTLEISLSRTWDAIAPRIAAERKAYRGGIRAALLGTSTWKEGQAVPRKEQSPGFVGWGYPVLSSLGTGEEGKELVMRKGVSMPLGVGGSGVMAREEEGKGGDGDEGGDGKERGDDMCEEKKVNGVADRAKRRETAPAPAPGHGEKTKWWKRSKDNGQFEGVSLAVREDARAL